MSAMILFLALLIVCAEYVGSQSISRLTEQVISGCRLSESASSTGGHQ